MSGAIVAVTGDKKFTDWALVQRALKAFHKKHHIDMLITGVLKGAEEFAFVWAKNECIRRILTLPPQPDMLDRKSQQLRNALLLEEYRPFAVIAFPGSEPQRNHMVSFARQHNINVWEVPANWS